MTGGMQWSGRWVKSRSVTDVDRSLPDANRVCENLRVVQLLLGHNKLESTVRYLGIEVDDALELAEQIEI